MDDTRQGYSRLRRIIRPVSLVLTIVGASLAVYWLIKWLRGDSDEYANQIMGGLTLATAMTLLASAEFVRASKARWSLLAAGATLAAINLVTRLMSARISLLMLVALLLIMVSIVATARVLWPARGVKVAEWRAAPVTLDQRRALCAGMAALNLGAALLCCSLFGVPRGPWQATFVAVFTTSMFLCSAIILLLVRARLRA